MPVSTKMNETFKSKGLKSSNNIYSFTYYKKPKQRNIKYIKT